MPRTLTIFFPDGQVEHWLTDSVFIPGDKLGRNGTSWIVTSIAAPDGSSDGGGKHETVTVRRNGDTPPA
jgi:hypothetical protein